MIKKFVYIIGIIILLLIMMPVGFFIFDGGLFSAYKENEKILFVGDFETGNFSGFQFSGNDEFEVVSSPVRNGKFAAKVTLRRFESKNGYRSEIVPVEVTGFRGIGERAYAKFNEEYWYRFSVFLPHDFVIDAQPESFMQMHGVPDRFLFEAYRHPPLIIYISGSNYMIGRNWDSKLITPDAGDNRYDGDETVVVGEIANDLGKWTDWVVNVNWSFADDGSGFMKIWKSGELVLERTGPNCFNDLRGGPYMKIGIYKWPWQKTPDLAPSTTDTRTIFIDEILIARGKAPFKDILGGGR